MSRPPFHLAFFVTDLDSTRDFYGKILGCVEGRSTESWVDFDFFGHQISAHVGDVPDGGACGAVDGDAVPMPHFGAVLPPDDWHALADRMKKAGVHFLLEPKIRFVGEPGEQGTMFVADPSGNGLEFKMFADPSGLFET